MKNGHPRYLFICSFNTCAHGQKSTWSTVGVVDRRNQHKPTICSPCGQYCLIPSKVKPVFLLFLVVWMLLQLTQVPISPDRAVFVPTTTTTTTTTTDGETDYFTTLRMCTGVIMNTLITKLEKFQLEISKHMLKLSKYYNDFAPIISHHLPSIKFRILLRKLVFLAKLLESQEDDICFTLLS